MGWAFILDFNFFSLGSGRKFVLGKWASANRRRGSGRRCQLVLGNWELRFCNGWKREWQSYRTFHAGTSVEMITAPLQIDWVKLRSSGMNQRNWESGWLAMAARLLLSDTTGNVRHISSMRQNGSGRYESCSKSSVIKTISYYMTHIVVCQLTKNLFLSDLFSHLEY